jgi:glycine/D-amino acid oxidase-like deaminating enzyme
VSAGVVVVGAGVSGLTAAHDLAAAGRVSGVTNVRSSPFHLVGAEH